MNILASYNWIREYLDTKDDAEEFAKKITLSGCGVENMIDEAKLYEGVVIGEVVELKEHPNADKLKIAVTNIGKKVEIVCGGVNLREGMKVAVATPGSSVRWHGEDEWTKLEEAEVRGVKSHGMICAAEELGLDKLQTEAKDIWDISELTDAKPGTAFAEALGFNDAIFDVEVTTNRPDAMCIIGLAREGHVVTGDDFEIKTAAGTEKSSEDKKLTVEVVNKELCPRYQAVVIDGVKVGPSPWWLQKRLLAAGHKPINNIVDITNYVLHEYAQPMHAFDYEKIEGNKIVVRTAKKGEKITVLDESEHELNKNNLVIADQKQPVAIAGVMGGMDTGVTDETSTIVFEAANFDPVSVRKTARSLNLQSDSQQLFEKGLSTEATGAAMSRAVELTLELAGGQVVSDMVDVRVKKYEPLKFKFDPVQAVKLIGVDIKEKEMVEILERLGFDLVKKEDVYEVVVPYWRDHDIEADVDLIEEIARVHGYDNLPSVIPPGEIPFRAMAPELVWERKIKEILCSAGATEAFSMSIISEDDLTAYDMSPKDAVAIANELSLDQKYMRPSLVPGLLRSIEANETDEPEMVWFELSRVFVPKSKDLPEELRKLLVGVSSPDGAKAFFEAKGIWTRLADEAGIEGWTLERGIKDKRWHEGRSAKIMIDGNEIGVIGEVSREVAVRFGIDSRVSLVDIDFATLLPHLNHGKSYTPPPEFPPVKRDLAFVLDRQTEYGQVKQIIMSASELIASVGVFDVYTGERVEMDKKSMAVHLEFMSPEKTLTGEEVETEVKKVIDVLEKQLSATIRG